MLKIKVISSQTSVEPRELELTPETMVDSECLIGQFPECDLVLASPRVSRLHGKISFQEGKYYFTDLASKSGSRVNNEEAKANQKYVLKTGDVIRIGEFSLTIQAVTLAAGTATPEVEVTTLDGDPTQISWWSKGEIAVRCVRVINETPDVKTFCFVSNPPVLFTYKPGQFVTLDLEINGEQVLRSYSISSSPSRPRTLEITVKRVPPPDHALDIPQGLVSNWLHDHITVGSEVKLSGPLGKFTCVGRAGKKLLMISAGSGITPMMSMSRWIYDTAANRDVVFLHSARSRRDVIFRQELELMAARQTNFRLAITTTRLEPGQSGLGFTGRLTEPMVQMIAPDFQERQVYVCGPESFMQGVKAMLKSLGFPMQNYYEESFGSAKKLKKRQKLKAQEQPTPREMASAQAPGFGLGAILSSLQLPSLPVEPVGNGHPVAQELVVSPPTSSLTSTSPQIAVVFAESGKEVASDGEESILEVAEQEGVKIRSSCRMGSCGTCKKLKTEGKVKMEGYNPEALDSSELEAGYILTCTAYPLGRVVINA